MFTTLFTLPKQSSLTRVTRVTRWWYLRSSQQLIHEDPERPEVHGPVVSLVEDDLRGDVLRGPAECPGLTTAVNVLRKAKIDHFNVALFICNTLTG